MAKIQNIYAIASDGTKITVTASAVGAVPTDQVATSSVLGLIKTGDNTIQGQENGVDVNYLEVNAAGKGFMPAFNISKYIATELNGGKYFLAAFYLMSHSDTMWYFIAKDVPTEEEGKYFWTYEPTYYWSLVTDEGGTEYKISLAQAVRIGKVGKDNVDGYSPVLLYNDASGNTQRVNISDILDGATDSFVLASGSYKEYKYYQAPGDLDALTGQQPLNIDNMQMGIMFSTADWDKFTTDSGVTSYAHAVKKEYIEHLKDGTLDFDDDMPLFTDFGHSDHLVSVSLLGTRNVNFKDYIAWDNQVLSDWSEPTAVGGVTSNRVILNDNKKLIVDIDNFQHASTTQYGIVQYPANYYYDDGTPKIATVEYAGVIKIDNDYTEYTPAGSLYAAALLADEDGIGYVNVFPATTTSIGSIMVSDSSTYDASTISNKTVAWVNLKDNRAFVYVNLASQQYRGSVRVQSKYTAYTTLDSQTAAYLRITDAGYGYVTVLPATTNMIGSFKAASKQTEYVSTDGNWCAPVEISSANVGFVRVFPATTSIIGSVGVVAKYTAYSTEDSQTAAYLRINSAGKAYTPMLTETWTFTVLDDSDNETTVDKNVVLG